MALPLTHNSEARRKASFDVLIVAIATKNNCAHMYQPEILGKWIAVSLCSSYVWAFRGQSTLSSFLSVLGPDFEEFLLTSEVGESPCLLICRDFFVNKNCSPLSEGQNFFVSSLPSSNGSQRSIHSLSPWFSKQEVILHGGTLGFFTFSVLE